MAKRELEINKSANAADSDVAPTFWQLFIVLLSVVTLGALTIDAVAPLPKEASRVLQGFDTVVCVIFIIDFFIRFKSAPDRVAFMKWGWIDLIASIPNIDILRWGRLARLLRIIQILRAVRSFQKVLLIVFRHRLRTGAGVVMATAFLLIVFSSMSILLCEQGPQANIKTAEDAVWWSLTTITTVGYGDKYPITLEGRIIATILMITGLGLVGVLSGVVASQLLGLQEKPSNDTEKILQTLGTLQEEVRELREKNQVEPGRVNRLSLERQNKDFPGV